MNLERRFLALWFLLGAVAVCAICGPIAILQLQPVKHNVAAVKASLGDQDLTRLATKYISDEVVAEGFAVVKIAILNTEQKGDAATVTARVTVTDGVRQQTVKVAAKFTRGVWSATGLAAA
jgi:hypothetical protein